MIVAIPDCPGYYVTDEGRVVSFWRRVRRDNRFRSEIGDDGLELKDFDRKLPRGKLSGYRSVALKRDGNRRRNYYVHELVLHAFVGPRPSIDHEVCHGDGVRENNRLGNLRWGTYADNADDRRKHGRIPSGADWWRHRRASRAAEELAAEDDRDNPRDSSTVVYVGAFDDLLEGAAQ